MGKRSLAGGLLLLALLLPHPRVWANGPEDARQLVVDTTQKTLDTLSREREAIKANPKRLSGLIDGLILPHFDFERMSRWVLGRHWRRATPEQRERFVGAFRTLLVRTYARALLEYADQTVRVLPLRAGSRAEQVKVRTEVRQPGGYPLPINYSLYLKNGTWKVYDVTIDGISLVSNYRNAFSSHIQRGGLDDLIALMEARNAR